MNDLLKYLMELPTDEARIEAINALSKEQKRDLAAQLVFNVQSMVNTIVENKDEIWLTGELPKFP